MGKRIAFLGLIQKYCGDAVRGGLEVKEY